MSIKPPSKTIFVGNIPYGLTEEQIKDIFSQAGTVLDFHLVYDHETGRPKGYGFAEYPDIDSASSAVRNLNDHDIMGRKLRVDFSKDGEGQSDNNQSNQQAYPNLPQNPLQNGNMNIPPPIVAAPPSTLPPLPHGIDLPAGVTCPDSISRTLNTLPPTQLLDVLSQMKTLCTTDPGKATELLHQAPQLSYAIFQALLLMGLVSPDALHGVMEGTPAAPFVVPSAAPGYGKPAAQSAYAAPPMGTPMMGTPAPAPNAGVRAQSGGYTPQPAYRQPPPVQVQAPAVAVPTSDDLMQQVLAMPQNLIDELPPAERAQLMAIRAQMGR